MLTIVGAHRGWRRHGRVRPSRCGFVREWDWWDQSEGPTTTRRGITEELVLRRKWAAASLFFTCEPAACTHEGRSRSSKSPISSEYLKKKYCLLSIYTARWVRNIFINNNAGLNAKAHLCTSIYKVSFLLIYSFPKWTGCSLSAVTIKTSNNISHRALPSEVKHWQSVDPSKRSCRSCRWIF